MFKRPAAALAASLLVTNPAHAQPVAIPLDAEVTVGGIPAACTGIGQTKNDPKWTAYPVRVEFSNPAREYLTDAEVTLSDASGRPLATVACGGAWVLFKVPAGRYRLEARLLNGSARAAPMSITAPTRGQGRFVLLFPG